MSSSDWGTVRFGRVNELSTETIRKFDPFYQDGIGGMITSSQSSELIDNTVRYDSPKWDGLSFGLSYSLGQDTENKDWYNGNPQTGAVPGKKYSNNGYAINLSYDNGPWMATANWSRIADSADSSVWNLGVAYKFGDARVMLSYSKTKDDGYHGGEGPSWSWGVPQTNRLNPISFSAVTSYGWVPLKSEEESWLLGLEWDIGPGQFDASLQRVSLNHLKSSLDGSSMVYDGKKLEGDVMKYAVGYTYNLSKRTSVYGQAVYIDWDSEGMGYIYNAKERESTTAIQIGMTHRF